MNVKEHEKEFMHIKRGTFWGAITIWLPIFFVVTMFKVMKFIPDVYELEWFMWGGALISVLFIFLVILWIPIIKWLCGDYK